MIVTEELHLITFETEVYHQGLKIDLEVSLNTKKENYSVNILLLCRQIYHLSGKVKHTFVAEMVTTISGLTISRFQIQPTTSCVEIWQLGLLDVRFI